MSALSILADLFGIASGVYLVIVGLRTRLKDRKSNDETTETIELDDDQHSAGGNRSDSDRGE